MKLHHVLIGLLVLPFLIPYWVVKRLLRPKAKLPELPAPDENGLTRPFADLAIAFDFSGFTLQPTRPGEPHCLKADLGESTLQLSKMSIDGAFTPEMIGAFAAPLLESLSTRFERVTQPVRAVALKSGIRGATLTAETEGHCIQVWALCHGTGLMKVTWTSSAQEVGGADAFVNSAAPSTAPLHVLRRAILEHIGVLPEQIRRETAQLRWVAPALRQLSPLAAYEPVAGDLGLVYVLAKEPGLIQAVTDEQLHSEKVSREQFKQWALANVDAAPLDIVRKKARSS